MASGFLRTLAFTVAALPAFGQALPPLPAFDVASIKPAPHDLQGGGYNFGPGGRTVITNFTLKNLVQIAWHLQDFQIAGGPVWVDSDRFNVEARAEGNPDDEQSRLMLRSLLADRFHLTVHSETRELPIYVLAVDTSGSQLREILGAKEGTCTSPNDKAGTLPVCGFRQRLRQDKGTPLMQLQGSSVTLALLARTLGTLFDRHVTDATGISGLFEINLEYAPEDHLLARIRPDASTTDNTGTDIFTALREQLSLKLESRKGPVEVLVIDHAEKPSEN
jgi:uncharacterized protein (TIGR03435 family)